MAIHSCKECATGMHWGERIVVLSVGKNYRHCLDELFTHRSRVASHGIRALCSIREDPGPRDGQSLFVCKKDILPKYKRLHCLLVIRSTVVT